MEKMIDDVAVPRCTLSVEGRTTVRDVTSGGARQAGEVDRRA